MKLFAANALIDGRSEVNEGDLVVLKHAWNNMDQRQILSELIDPVIADFFAEHPELAPTSNQVSLTQLSEECGWYAKSSFRKSASVTYNCSRN